MVVPLVNPRQLEPDARVIELMGLKPDVRTEYVVQLEQLKKGFQRPNIGRGREEAGDKQK